MKYSGGLASPDGFHARGSAPVLSRVELSTVGREFSFEQGASAPSEASHQRDLHTAGGPQPDLRAGFLPDSARSADDQVTRSASASTRRTGESVVVDIFWILHDERGVRRVSLSTANLVLAAALLWDLRDFVAIGDGGITVTRVDACADPVEAEILWYLAAEERRHHSTAVWLEFIASREVYGRTASRLVREGSATVRGVLRKHYEATSIASTWPGSRLLAVYRAQKRFDDEDVVLAALVLAAGLQGQILYDDTASAVACAQRQIAGAPEALQALYRCTAAAVGKAVEVRR